MKIFNFIFGIFSIIAAVYCIFYPGVTFLNSGWIVSVLLGIWGICSIFAYTSSHGKQNKSKSEAVMGILGLVGGISAAIVSVSAIFIPSVRVLLDIIIICVFSSWLIISGITSVISSFKAKASGCKSWIITLICGILIVIAGIYGIFHLIFAAQTIGIIIGILLMVYGIRLIVASFEKS